MITLTVKTYQVLIKRLKREEKKIQKHLLNSIAYKSSRARTVTNYGYQTYIFIIYFLYFPQKMRSTIQYNIKKRQMITLTIRKKPNMLYSKSTITIYE